MRGEVSVMVDTQKKEAARRFSSAADAMVDACRLLEQCGMDDEPIEDLLQALEAVTRRVHRMHLPDDRVQLEPADAAAPACHIPFQDGGGAFLH